MRLRPLGGAVFHSRQHSAPAVVEACCNFGHEQLRRKITENLDFRDTWRKLYLLAKLQVRPLEADDTHAVVQLYKAASARDANIGPITAAQWSGFVQRPQNHGGMDFRVILHDDRLVGLAESSLRDQNGQRVRFFKLVVEPLMRRQGVGTALLRELLSLAAPDEHLSFQTLANNDWHDGIAFLEGYGFSHIESEISMRCSSLTVIEPQMPAEVSIEQCARPVGLAEDVARLHNAAFASDVSFRPYTATEMAALLAEEGQKLWIVREAADILGYCQLHCDPQSIWLEQIAIDPVQHGHGLGMALAYAALKGADLREDHAAGLNVSSANGAARSMYKKLGFIPRRETRRYSARQMDLNNRLPQISCKLSETAEDSCRN